MITEQDTNEVEKLATELRILVLARRRFSVENDREGIDLLDKFFSRVEEIDKRLISNVSRSVVGCGASFTKANLEMIKQRVREELEAA